MVRSIRVYRYNYPPSLAQVRIKLDNTKKIPNPQQDQNNSDEQIDVPSILSEMLIISLSSSPIVFSIYVQIS